jgi:predicted TIM-barrel fold metal-dependent hydrolase
MYFDADTHVDENDETWSYLPKKLQYLAPKTVEFNGEAPPWLTPDYTPIGDRPLELFSRPQGSAFHRFWYLDGQLYPRRVRSDEVTGTTRPTRELDDVAARVADMDRMGVDVQVIYPTLFLDEVSRRLDVEVALYRSYNRWVADRCSDSAGRLRFVAMIPYSSPPEALKEIKWAKEHGAAGLWKRTIENDNKAASDPFFFPAYKLAEDLGMPLCIHVSSPWRPVVSFLAAIRAADSTGFPVLSAFASMLDQKVWARFPDLKVGFVEAGSEWLPHLLHRNKARATLKEMRFFVTCEWDEDLPYLISQVGGADNFIVGTDYCHGDRSSVIDMHPKIEARGDLDERTVVKLTSHNARNFYDL